jgi:hypothetical protein|tara:strand:+ start:679 stop:909 length:231 start_codon:yes stop_codon:yes gene_type:complete
MTTLSLNWNDLSHRMRAQISIDSEPNYVRSMLDRLALTISEQQIEALENALTDSNQEIVKQILFDHLIDCIFDDVD